MSPDLRLTARVLPVESAGEVLVLPDGLPDLVGAAVDAVLEREGPS